VPIAKQRDIDRREAEVVRDVERGAVVEQELHELGVVGRVIARKENPWLS
jgi:hypothetical protein